MKSSVSDNHSKELNLDSTATAPQVGSKRHKQNAAVAQQEPEHLPLGGDPRIYSKIFVISGSLSSLTHAEVRAALENRGALFSRRVSKKTDYLIVGRKPGSEAVTARIYEIPLLTEADLLHMLGINKQFSLDLYWPDIE
jgi:NAD-dependent DNA ligase